MTSSRSTPLLSTLSTPGLESLEFLEHGAGHPRGNRYGIESRTPDGDYRFIEVKARHPETDSVTVTKNEVVVALKAPDRSRLTVVLMDDGKSQEQVYVNEPREMGPDFHVTSVSLRLDDPVSRGELIGWGWSTSLSEKRE